MEKNLRALVSGIYSGKFNFDLLIKIKSKEIYLQWILNLFFSDLRKEATSLAESKWE